MKTTFSFWNVVVKNLFAMIKIIFLISHLDYTLVYSVLKIRKKLNQFEWIFCVDTDNTFHNTKLTNSKAALYTDQEILPWALHSEVWSYSRMGNSSESTFLHLLQDNELSSFGAALINQVVQFFIQCITTTLALCVTFANFSAFKFLGRLFGSSLYSIQPVFHSIPCQFLVHQNALALWLWTFGGQNE